MELKWRRFRLTGRKDFENTFFKAFKGKKLKKDQILIVLLAGILLLVIAIPGGDKKETEDRGKSTFLSEEGKETRISETEYVAQLEEKLEGILSEMEGAGKVSVMITLAESREKVVEKDTQESREQVTESDSRGGKRTTKSENRSETAVNDEAEGDGRSPYVSKELSPKVEGVVVIAPGGNNAVVVKNITEAVQALFGIDTHKIRIVKGRREA